MHPPRLTFPSDASSDEMRRRRWMERRIMMLNKITINEWLVNYENQKLC